ncbi:MAG: DUF5777 family beta-barrel protein, partial [Acidobacteriota bacterium]
MKGKIRGVGLLAFLLVFSAAAFGFAEEKAQASLPGNIKNIIKKNCSISGCHKGKQPAANLNFEPDKFVASVVDVPSSEVPALKIVDTAEPEKSYLLAKIKGEPGIVGKRMPADRDPLTEGQIGQVETWIRSLRGSMTSTAVTAGQTEPSGRPRPADSAPAFSKPAFWGTRLVNLPTTTTLSKGEVLFRISHRFQPPVSSGWDSFYGLDGPAFILFSLGYGITDKITLTVGRSKLYQEWDVQADWLIFEQG